MDLIEADGLMWPASDKHCRNIVLNSLHEMKFALANCRARRVAVQAGGNCGVWARYLASQFDQVVTAEPDPTNFAALTANLRGFHGVLALPVAFGDGPGTVGLHTIPSNVGAHFVEGPGEIQVATIDSLDLYACDYLCLDVEGYEMPALRGAVQTIKTHRPVIQIEDKGLSEKYGYAKGDAEKWAAYHFGYRVGTRIGRDVVLLPPET